MAWTQFWDMHSGGRLKTPYHYIFIEAPMDEATAVFYSRFGQHPYDVACGCCGCNFSVSEDETLTQATGFHRGLGVDDQGNYLEEGGERRDWYAQPLSLEQFVASGEALIIRADEITDDERSTYVPEPDDDYWEDDE
jgi:hypothetical protein